jgi:hypothetical protein
MNMQLKTELMPYSENQLQQWITGDYSMLTSSNASNYIKKILITKAKKRPGRRFFGEAFISCNVNMIDGWYNSYKWLSAKKWLTGKGLKSDFEKSFYCALERNFGKDAVDNLQQKSISFFQNHKNSLSGKPVAPDLWIIGEDKLYRFIESKLPGDTINPRQIAGLALIKKHLEHSNPISVSIVCLYPENGAEPELIDYSKEFLAFYRLA